MSEQTLPDIDDERSEPTTGRRGLGSSYRKLFGATTISNLGDGIGIVAYPWLASAVTRDPLLIAVVAVVQRLPWLLFTLPAGVLTDRHDRRRLMVLANVIRAALTFGVAFVVLGKRGALPGPDEIDDAAAVVATDTTLYLLVLLATMLLGVAEVLHDNAAQTFLPAIVDTDDLEKANGRIWSAEMIANTFVGPPLGAALLVVAFSVPFFVDATTFLVAAILVAFIPAVGRAPREPATERTPWTAELKEGFSWLWSHELLRPLAIILGLLNMFGMMLMATLVLFAQEVLATTPTEFAILTTGGAVGGVVGGWSASAMAKRLGAGPSLMLTLSIGGLSTIVIGLATHWLIVWAMFAVSMLFGTLWNVITVSLRQAIIPDHLLGRVNSVYRFFAWGMMPVGAALGGLTVVVTEVWFDRDIALRAPFIVAGALQLVLYLGARTRLTTARIDAARAAERAGPA